MCKCHTQHDSNPIPSALRRPSYPSLLKWWRCCKGWDPRMTSPFFQRASQNANAGCLKTKRCGLGSGQFVTGHDSSWFPMFPVQKMIRMLHVFHIYVNLCTIILSKTGFLGVVPSIPTAWYGYMVPALLGSVFTALLEETPNKLPHLHRKTIKKENHTADLAWNQEKTKIIHRHV